MGRVLGLDEGGGARVVCLGLAEEVGAVRRGAEGAGGHFHRERGVEVEVDKVGWLDDGLSYC